MMELTDLHRRLLAAGEFYLDGWMTERGRKAAFDLVDAGYAIAEENGSDEQQYTVINFTVTEAGRNALSGDDGETG